MADDYTTSIYSSGNRSSLIVATSSFVAGAPVQNAVDGDFTADASHAWYWNEASQDNTGDWIEWVFDAPIIMTGLRHYQSNGIGNGNWKAQYWDGASWVDVSGGAFFWNTGGVSYPTAWEALWTNSTASDTWRILGTGGDRHVGSTYQIETEFKISDGAAPTPVGDIAQTLAAVSQAASGTVGSGTPDSDDDVVLIITE